MIVYRKTTGNWSVTATMPNGSTNSFPPFPR